MMSPYIEDTLRSALRDQAAEVVGTKDYASFAISAGRQARRRRQIGVVVLASAVAVLLVGASGGWIHSLDGETESTDTRRPAVDAASTGVDGPEHVPGTLPEWAWQQFPEAWKSFFVAYENGFGAPTRGERARALLSSLPPDIRLVRSLSDDEFGTVVTVENADGQQSTIEVRIALPPSVEMPDEHITMTDPFGDRVSFQFALPRIRSSHATTSSMGSLTVHDVVEAFDNGSLTVMIANTVDEKWDAESTASAPEPALNLHETAALAAALASALHSDDDGSPGETTGNLR